MGDYSGAKLYLDSSLAIVMKGNDLFKQSLSKNNLAAFYVHLGEYDAAFKILEECISINKQHGWFEQLSFNYANMSSAFSKQGNYRPAFEYLEKYYSIDDSLKGAKVKLNIANLIASNAIKEKEIALTKSKLALAKSQDALIFRTIFLVMILTLVVIGILFWSWQSQKNKKERVQNIERLSELTQILLKKNSLLSEMEKELEKNSDLKIQIAETQNFDTNLYNQRILTVEDWSAFKTHFESAYPGYLIRLRNTYSTLTEAEERLFIFIKLNLKSKEIASMLGISIDTVKKTRYRLRKRIELTEEEDLDAFVLRF